MTVVSKRHRFKLMELRGGVRGRGNPWWIRGRESGTDVTGNAVTGNDVTGNGVMGNGVTGNCVTRPESAG